MSANIHPLILKAVELKLTYVDLTDDYNHSVTYQDLEYLSIECQGVTTIIGSFSDSVFIKALSKFSALKKLHLFDVLGSDSFWETLVSLSSLKCLIIERSYGLSERFFEVICNIPQLRALQIIFSEKIYTHYLRHLHHARYLNSVYIDNCHQVAAHDLTDEVFFYLSKIKTLKFLGTSNSFSITSKGLNYLKETLNLRSILLSHFSIEEIAPLGNITNLESLSLYCDITNEGLKIISKFKRLKHLRLYGCEKVSKEGINQLLLLPKLQSLYLYKASLITGQEFAEFIHLEKLLLHGSKSFSPEGICILSSLTNLKKLSILRSDSFKEEYKSQLAK